MAENDLDWFLSDERNLKNIEFANNIDEKKYEKFHIIWFCCYDNCCKISKSWYQATSHMVEHIDDHSKVFQCKYCAVPLRTHYETVLHLAGEHTTKLYKCKACHLWSKTLKDLQLHLSKKRYYQCKYCPLHFPVYENYLQHHILCEGNVFRENV